MYLTKLFKKISKNSTQNANIRLEIFQAEPDEFEFLISFNPRMLSFLNL